MKTRKNIRGNFVVGLLIAFTLTLFGISFTATTIAYAEGGELGQQSEKSTVFNDKSARLLTVLDDKIAMISDEKNILSDIKIVYGFNGDTYVAVECEPTGYMIYHPASGTFVETSQKSISPYFGLSGDELYYCGPTRYFQFVNNEFVHTVLGYAFNDEESVLALFQNSELVTNTLKAAPNEGLLDFVNKGNSASYPQLLSASSSESSMTSMSSSNVSGSVGSTGYDWFSNLSTCGYISGGHCGFIALNMLYGYLDKFSNDKYMPNTHWTDIAKSADNRFYCSVNFCRYPFNCNRNT